MFWVPVSVNLLSHLRLACKTTERRWHPMRKWLPAQVDAHLDRFMADLRRRIRARGGSSEASSGTASEVDAISETIHLTLKTSGASPTTTRDTASSRAPGQPGPGAPEVSVHSVAVSAPVDVPLPAPSKDSALAMDLCKPPGASGMELWRCVLVMAGRMMSRTLRSALSHLLGMRCKRATCSGASHVTETLILQSGCCQAPWLTRLP